MAIIKGKIIKSIGGFYHVEAPEDTYICKARGVFRLRNISPCAGDIVTVETDGENEPLITEVHERKNMLIRPPLANLDLVFIIVSTVDPKPNSLVLDKLIFIVESKGIEPVLIFTKTDKKEIGDFSEIYIKAGFCVFHTDNVTGAGTDEIRNAATNKVSAFIGNSGVGKSSLLNRLLPHLNLGTAEISKKLGRGKHTTRQVELYKLPCGGYIADTPGFSTVEESRYGSVPSAEVANYFREFGDFLDKCRYVGCSHTKEEECAVIEAVNSGAIAKSRYDSFIKIYTDTKANENSYK